LSLRANSALRELAAEAPGDVRLLTGLSWSWHALGKIHWELRQTGERMTHYIIARGRFEGIWGELYRTGFRLQWEASPPQPTNRAKIKYACPDCGLNVWGKPGLAGMIICLEGNRPFVAVC
jgi:hypothetical protein